MAKRPSYYDQLSPAAKKWVDEAEDFDPLAPDETEAVIVPPTPPRPRDDKPH